MMIVPEAANMPPTTWRTEIFEPEIWAWAVPRKLVHALLTRVHAIDAGMHVGGPAAVGGNNREPIYGGRST